MQIPAALTFLKRRRRILERLAKETSISERYLTFTFCPGNAMHYETFPSALLELAGKLRIEITISFYPKRGHDIPIQS